MEAMNHVVVWTLSTPAPITHKAACGKAGSVEGPETRLSRPKTTKSYPLTFFVSLTSDSGAALPASRALRLEAVLSGALLSALDLGGIVFCVELVWMYIVRAESITRKEGRGEQHGHLVRWRVSPIRHESIT